MNQKNKSKQVLHKFDWNQNFKWVVILIVSVTLIFGMLSEHKYIPDNKPPIEVIILIDEDI